MPRPLAWPCLIPDPVDRGATDADDGVGARWGRSMASAGRLGPGGAASRASDDLAGGAWRLPSPHANFPFGVSL